MKASKATKILSAYDRQGHTVWSLSGLRAVLPERTPAFRKTLERLCADETLSRVSRGVYLFGQTVRDRREVFGELIAELRKGEYCFESLESAASEWGIFPQTPLGVITVLTTGRSGSFGTPYGRVEFVHTSAPVGEIIANTVQRERFIPIATRNYTIHGLRRCGRTTQLEEATALARELEGEG